MIVARTRTDDFSALTSAFNAIRVSYDLPPVATPLFHPDSPETSED
jgi:hypothetical protein